MPISTKVTTIIRTPSAETGSKLPASERSKITLVITAVPGVNRHTAELSSRSEGMNGFYRCAAT